MNPKDLQLMVGLIRSPSSVLPLSLHQWDLLIRQARTADALARICEQIGGAGQLADVPEQVRRHLLAAQLLARRQQTELSYEVRHIADALRPAAIPWVILKGAAYAQAGLQAAKGRMVSDVDILVPRERLADAESALMKAGWLTSTRDAYDQHYYRKWMHEIPALRHMHRGSVLDVHHSVVPPTAGYALDSHRLLDAAVPVGEDHDDIRVLCDVDMVLHSAVHLMHEGELEMGFRGLVDLDALLGEFSSRPAFWDRLVERARVLGLEHPTFLALRYTQRLIGTPMPDGIWTHLRSGARGLTGLRLAVLDFLYDRALRPHHVTLSDRWTPMAKQMLYVRSHALRMPLYLLLPHLARKSWRRFKATFQSEESSNAQA